MYRFTIAFIMFILFSSSCFHNRIRYIQDKNEQITGETDYPNRAPEYLVNKKDILYVRIASTNKEVNQLFNLSMSQSSAANSGRDNFFYLNGIIVNDSGYIYLPVVGDVFVEGKTRDEINSLLTSKIGEHVNNAEVFVSLVSFYVSFIGEFNSQGKITVMQDNLNILDAVAIAGGISDYGNKQNILVLRQTEEGTKTFRVDLTKRSLLVSEKYFLKPNDILIAEPVKSKSFQLGIRDYSLVLTTLTSTITMVLLVINLMK
jgi:polysaccharide export outer membrane protein